MINSLLSTFYFIILITYGVKSYSNSNCHNIIEMLEKCENYKCTADFFEEKKIEYEIFISKENNKCKFIEKDLSGVTVCDIENYGRILIKDYLKNILSYNAADNNNYSQIENFRYKYCYFYNNENYPIVRGIKPLNKDTIDNFERINELENRKTKEASIKSIFFNEQSIEQLKEVTKNINYDTKSSISFSNLYYPNSTNILPHSIKGYDFYDKVISLDSIVYLSPKDWRIWVNGKVFQNYQNLLVTNVTADKVTFLWKPDYQEKNTPISKKDINYLEFTLCTGEAFDLNKEKKNNYTNK